MTTIAHQMTTIATRPKVSNGWLIGFIVTTGLLILFRGTVESSIRGAAVVACVVVVVSVAGVVRANPDRPISAGSTYALLFGLFHAGLLIPTAIGTPVRLLNPRDEQWVSSPGFASAATLVAIAQCAFSVGYFIRHQVKGGVIDRIGPKNVLNPTEIVDGPGAVGISLLSVGLVIWSYNALISGVSIIGSSYGDFLTRTTDTNMPIAYMMIGFGLSVVSSSRHRSIRRWALALFALWALPAFTIGLRGEVIIPSAVFAVVAARRRKIPLRLWMVLAAIGVLAAGSAVRVIRQFGLGSGDAALKTFNPFDGITELGYSIRPLTVVSNFHDRLGEPFVGIATYLAPFRRAILGRVLGGEVLSVPNDQSVFSGMIRQRVGTIGGSPAAEAYRAGGVLGMLCVMILIGLLIAHLDSVSSTRLNDAAVGMSTFMLLLWVRNDFTPVPIEFAAMVLVLVSIWLFEQRHQSGSRTRQFDRAFQRSRADHLTPRAKYHAG